jgi:hypothetical protein
MLVLSFIPLLLVGALLAWAFVALLRQSEGGLELFADAVWTWAGSVVGIWLGLAIVGSVLGLTRISHRRVAGWGEGGLEKCWKGRLFMA